METATAYISQDENTPLKELPETIVVADELIQSNNKPSHNEAELQENIDAVFKVLSTLSSVNSYYEAVESTLLAVKEAFGWAYGSYWEIDEQKNALTFAKETGNVNTEFQSVTQKAAFEKGIGLSGRVWDTESLMFVRDLSEMKDCCRAPVAQKAGVKSGICFPIKMNNKVVGTMDFFALETLSPSENRLETLRNIGSLVSSALERITVAENQTQDTLAFKSTLEALSNVENEDEIIQTALNTIKESFGWVYGSFWRVDTDSNVLTFETESGTVNHQFEQVTRNASFEKGVGLSGRVWQQQDLMFVSDLSEMKDCCRAPVAQKAGVKSGMCFPILINGKVIGTMDFFTVKTLYPSENRMDAFRNVGHLVSQALTRAIKNQMQLKTAEEAAEASNEISKNAAEAADMTQKATEIGNKTENAVNNLNQSAQAINNVVELIRGIASQTNLLALNATIEAASAGDAGKGFAVVANEVKELATQAASATDDIRRQIEAIQENTSLTTVAIKEINEIVTNINATNTSIAGAIEEQSIIIHNLAEMK